MCIIILEVIKLEINIEIGRLQTNMGMLSTFKARLGDPRDTRMRLMSQDIAIIKGLVDYIKSKDIK